MAGSPKILLVEDNPQIMDMYTSVLTKAGYDLAVATTGDEALQKAPVFKPDIIFLDIMLPGSKTGIDALTLFRTDESYGCKDASIIMLTNLGLTDRLEEVWREYADGYIVKADIVPHDLLDIIKSLEGEEESQADQADEVKPAS